MFTRCDFFKCFTVYIALGLMASSALAATIYVKSDASGANNGSSWTDAYTTLQPAIAAAASGDQVWVAAGTYYPTTHPNGGSADREMHFSLKNGVAVYGGFAGTETLLSQRSAGSNGTILSGDFNDDDVVAGSGDTLVFSNNTENAYHVFYHPSSAALDTTAILDSVTVTGGSADSVDPHNFGGGMYNNECSPTISNCTFSSNVCLNAGGGVFNYTSSPVLTNCTFYNNKAYNGGGMCSIETSPAVLTNCTFYDNLATNPTNGGTETGGGLYNFLANLDVKNCIFWGNMPTTQIYNPSSTPTLSFCVVEGGYAGGTNIVTDDPQLSPLANNGGPTKTCAIPTDSSAVCIPEGGNSWNGCPASDQRGFTRPSGDRAIGAFDPNAPYTLIFNAGTNGTLSSGSDTGETTITQTVAYQADAVAVTAVPAADHHFLNWTNADGSVYSTANPLQINGVTANVNITANFNSDVVTYVNATASGANDGSSWDNGYTNLQDAIDAAGNGDQVWVAAGTYKPTSHPNGGSGDREMHFSLKNGVTLYGGFSGSEALLSDRDPISNETVLSGDIGVADDISDNCYHVFYHPDTAALDSTSVLDGFVISKGNADQDSSPHDRGAGMCNYSSSPTVVNCTFVSNRATNLGGAVYNNTSVSKISSCTFTQNATANGGAVQNSSSTVEIANCTFYDNIASTNGGGVRNSGGASTVVNCTFSANIASEGGGLYNSHSAASIAKNCIFWGNTASSQIANEAGSSVTVSQSVVEGGYADGTDIVTDDPLLGSLVNSGGSTLTCAIPSTSPAIVIPKGADSWNSCPDTDQRGYNRPSGDADLRAIGAYQPEVGKPALQTEAITSIAATTASSGGTFLDEGTGFTISSKGVCWSINENPTISDSFVASGSGFGDYTTSLSGLSAGVVYYVRAYAQLNDGSYIYGQNQSFKTIRKLYVVSGGSGDASGSDWANAMSDPQAAIDAATEVWVAKGTYMPTSCPNRGSADREKHFSLQNGVAVYGGFAGNESALDERDIAANPTILSGDIGVADDSSDNCYHVFLHTSNLKLDSTAVLDGFTITCGKANGSASAADGGGMYNDSASPMLTNCVFSDNNSSDDGGGIYNFFSSPIIKNCTVNNNSASYGGGLFNDSNSSPVITNSTFYANSASRLGGVFNYKSSPTLTNCTFSTNVAGVDGGGMYNYLSPAPTVKNCIFWGNSPATQIYDFDSTLTLSFSVVQGGYAGGTDVVTDDPVLGDLACNGGPTPTCAITTSSSAAAAIPIADSWNGCPDTDQRGFNRPAGGSDKRAIGAYEPGVGAPALMTDAVTNITGTSAESGGSFIENGSGFTITDKGVCWAIHENPTINDDFQATGSSNFDSFTAPLSSLSAGFTYYVRAYALLNDGTYVYGPSQHFKTIRKVYVKSGGAGDGSDWDNAMGDVQAAIDAATEVWVAKGTYMPTTSPRGGSDDRDKHFSLENGVAVYGGFAGTETLLSERKIDENTTILSGDIGVEDDNSDNCYNVFYHGSALELNSTAVLDGFTITGGNGGADGAGMTNVGASPTVANCIFKDNSCSDYGGGMLNYSSSSPEISNCSFINNSTENGGGIANHTNSSPVITNSSFSNNSATFGGGIHNNSSSSPTITNCTINNNSSGSGGGIYNFTNCSPAVTNSTICNNSADYYGAGIYSQDNCSTIITNSTIAYNKTNYASITSGSAIANSSSTFTVKNSIIWGNAHALQLSNNNSIQVSNCVVQGGHVNGTNLITDDPQLGFLADNGGPTMTCAIPANSSAVAIPQGSDSWNGCPDTDQRGYSRSSSGNRAMGAYEPSIGQPALNTADVTDKAGSTAVSGGFFVNSGGGVSVISKGLCWSKQKNPTVQDSSVSCGTGTAAFSGSITGLEQYETYYVRAYAKLSDDSFIYGQNIKFVSFSRAFVVPGGAGTKDGTSWENAYADPQVAIENATEVWVAAGTYTPTSYPNGGSTDRYMHFALKSGVAVYGGFYGTETQLSQRDITENPTIFSGDIGTEGDVTDNCYHVFNNSFDINPGESAVLDGVIIYGGNADGISAPYDGGGMYNYNSSPIISNCTFSNNTAAANGGGIYNSSANSPSLNNCTFNGNTALLGSGIYNDSSSPTISDSLFNANTATSSACIYNRKSSPTITNCTFTGNIGKYCGALTNSASSPIITNCTFTGNTATDDSGGGALDHNTGGSPVYKNCIFWGNSPIEIDTGGWSIAVDNCVVKGGFGDGTDIITDDPQLEALADNGGPTMTCAIPADSSAVALTKGGDSWNGCPDTDQRGLTRPSGDSDVRAIGAFDPGYKYTINFDIAGNGTLASGSESGKTSITQFIKFKCDTAAVTANPVTGYHFTGWTGDIVSSENPLVLQNVTEDMTVTANFAINSYTVKFISGTNGSLNGITTQVINHGNNCSVVKANPVANYHFTGWIGDVASTDNPLIIKNVSSDMTITANFAIDSYTVKFSAGENGRLEGNATQTINHNENCSEVTAVPDTGYKFVNWTGDVTSTDNPLIISSVTKNLQITANFTITSNVIRATASAGGKIEPLGDVEVEYGSTKTFSFVPEDGFQVQSCQVDGAEVPVSESYTFSSVTSAHTINVTFASVPAQIAQLTMATTGDGTGVTSPAVGTSSQALDTPISIVATPDEGSYFDGWSVSGGAAIVNTNKRKTQVTLSESATVTATFRKISTQATANLKLTASPVAGGSVAPAETVTVETDTATVITAKPAEGYFFIGWQADKASANILDDSSAVTKVVIYDDSEITASFGEIPTEASLTVASSPVEGGFASPSGSVTTETGVAVNIEATPADGYYFKSWQVEGPAQVADAQSNSTTVKISSDATVTAIFTTEDPGGKVMLTMASYPDNAGTTVPEVGTGTNVYVDEEMEVSAVAEDGWVFVSWTSSDDGITIDEEDSSLTVVKLSEAATLTANFAKEYSQSGSVKMVANHKEKLNKKTGVITSTDKYSLAFKTTLPDDMLLPETDAPLSFAVNFGNYSFSGTTDDKTVFKAKYDSTKGGCVIFCVRNGSKIETKVSFKWNKKRLLNVNVTGKPAPDPVAGVSNIIDLTAEEDGTINGAIEECSILFGSAKLDLLDGRALSYTAKKKTKNDLVSWSAKGNKK